MNDKDFIIDYINKQKLATIATINESGKPEAAVVGFGITESLEVLFGTNNKSRKYQNLKSNKSVAVVIGWDQGQTVQYEGEARELPQDELAIIEEYFWSKSPDAKKHHSEPGQCYFMISPEWIRYTDLKVKPWKVIELSY